MTKLIYSLLALAAITALAGAVAIAQPGGGGTESNKGRDKQVCDKLYVCCMSDRPDAYNRV